MMQKDFIVQNLDSGVVVLNQDSSKVQYSNQAACKMAIVQEKSFRINVQNKDSSKPDLLDIKAQAFTAIDKALFKKEVPNFEDTIKAIEETQKKFSLEKIIKIEAKKGYNRPAHTFKTSP